MHCELLKDCSFFDRKELASHPALIGALKEVYCEGNPSICARQQAARALGRDGIPDDLKPSQNERAEKLIAEAVRATKVDLSAKNPVRNAHRVFQRQLNLVTCSKHRATLRPFPCGQFQ